MEIKIKIKKIGYTIFLLSLLIFLNPYLFAPTQAAIQSDGTTTIIQNFEDEPPQDGWNYANLNHFQRSPAHKQGSYSLQALALGSSGVTYDGVQQSDVFVNGYIEAWIYAKGSQYGAPAVWLRTSTNDGTGSSTFKEGYMLRMYNTYAKIFHVAYDGDNAVITDLSDSLNLGLINNKWWHVKFEVSTLSDDSILLKGWITTSGTFSEVADISERVTDENYKIKFGKAGISARTNLQPDRYEYFDAVKISYSYIEWYEGFEEVDYADDWDFAHSSYFTRTTSFTPIKEGDYSLMVTPNSNGQTYDGVQHCATFEDGSIECGTYLMISNYLVPALWIRTSIVDPSKNPTFRDGYFLRLYVNNAALGRRDGDQGGVALDSMNIGYISDEPWHLKLKATGTLIEAWVTTDDIFSAEPQLSWDTKDDTIKYTEGKAGFSARTKMSGSNYKTFFDGIRIKYQEPEPIPPTYQGYVRDNYGVRVKEATVELKENNI